MRHLNEENIDDTVNDEQFVILDYYADWCGPCRAMSKILESLDDEMDQVEIVKVDIDEHQDIARDKNISSIPTLELYNDGEKCDVIVGTVGKSELKNKIEECG